MKKYSFKNDYSDPGHPRVLEALGRLNPNYQYVGYGLDKHCLSAQQLIRNEIKNDTADVHFVSGGTQANLIVLAALLNSKEATLAAETAHINVHEAGAVESVGHKIVIVENEGGKVVVDSIKEQLALHEDEHMVEPKVLYISQATELGTLYTKEELLELRKVTDSAGLYLFIDGARIAAAMAAEQSDFDLSDIAEFSDVFYIGGTKNGGLYGEAIVITNDEVKPEFRRYIKQRGGLLAKAFAMGAQFEELFKDGLYYELGEQSIKAAKVLKDGLVELNVKFEDDSPTNQLFPTFPNEVVDRLEELYDFYVWTPGEEESQIRLVTGWDTPAGVIAEFLNDVKKLSE